MKISKRILYTGRVQGVGFRYSVKQIAMGFDVTGWVHNLPDGRVELQVAGEAAELEAFLAEVSGGHLARYIKQIAQENIDVPPGSLGFEIRH